MSSPNFSLYFDSLLMLKQGEKLETFSMDVVNNLEKWGYIDLIDGKVTVSQKGLNVLEFYLKNKEFMNSCTSGIQKSILQTYSK